MWKIREPDLVIGDPPQTLRWHLFRWRGVQVALHKWVKSDSDRALHDHSADNISILLTGGYWEWIGLLPDPRPCAAKVYWRHPFVPYFRRAETPHRVALVKPVWTIWIRFKPRRSWGFWCPKGWRRWQEFVAERSYATPGSRSTVGRGCD